MNKDIFQYSNGEKAVFGDPLVILQTLTLECEGDVKGVYKLVESENPMQSIPAQWRLIAAARKAFKMPPPIAEDGSGATNEVVYSVLEAFWEWWAKKKANTVSKPMSEPPSDQWEAIRNYVASGQT